LVTPEKEVVPLEVVRMGAGGVGHHINDNVDNHKLTDDFSVTFL
jgi:hypothetical protein